MTTLKTPAEFDPEDERLSARCVASLMDELQAAHASRMDAVRDALGRLRRGDSMDLNFRFTFNTKEL